MKKIFMLIFFLLFLIVSCKALSEEEQMINTASKGLSKYHSKFEIHNMYDCNFLGNDNKQKIVFMEAKRNSIPSKYNYLPIKKAFLFIFNNNKLINLINVPHYYNENDFEDEWQQEKLGNFTFGIRLPEGWIYDFNQNGKDEIIVNEVCGSCLEFRIFEYQNKKFEQIAPADLYNYYIDNIDFNNRAIYLSSKRDVIKLYWNEDSKRYEKIVLESK